MHFADITLYWQLFIVIDLKVSKLILVWNEISIPGSILEGYFLVSLSLKTVAGSVKKSIQCI